MSSIGRISLDLNVNNRGFNRQVNGIQKQTTKAFNSMSVAVGNIIANMAASAAASIGNFVKDSINKGSELQELQNVVDSVFTTMSDKVEEFSQNALKQYGLTEAQSKKMVGTYGAMAKSFGYTEKQAFNMSAALTGLTADVASFYNLSHDESYTKLKSVFTGETESLKELGVVMTQTALDQFALEKGFGKTTKAMSEQEKVALRFAFVQDKLSTAAGDFIRTEDNWANQTRVLTGQFDSLKAALGQGFINVLTPVIQMLNTLLAKLVQVANAFKSFTEMVMGKSGGGGNSTGAAMKAVAESAASAATSTGGIEDAAEGAAGAAKKAQKALMGFDEINKLTKNTGAGGGGGSGDFSFNDVEFGAIEEQEPAINNALDKIKAKVKELIDLFKSGFKAGLGDDFENSIARMQEHLANIKDNLREIFTDEKVVSAASGMLDKIAYALGQFTGSLTSIGMSIAEMVVGGIDKYLERSKNFIKRRLVGIFDATGETAKIVGNLWETIAKIFEVFRGDSAKQVTGDLIGIVSNASLGMIDLATRLGRDIMNCIAQPIIENKDKIKEALENTLEPLSTITTTLNESVIQTFEKIFAVYETQVRPALQGIADGLSAVLSTIFDAYNTYVAPVLDNLATKFSEVWAGHIQPLINTAIEYLGKLFEYISFLWQSILVPLIDWIINTLVPAIMPILETIFTAAMNVIGAIADAISGIIEILSGFIDFIIGVFTGNWSLAWEGIGTIFSGIWNTILGVLTTVWELMKGVILTALEAIKGTISTVLNAISTLFTQIWTQIKTTVTTIVDAISTAIKNAFTGMWNFLKGIFNTILGGVEKLVNGVISGINRMIDSLNGLRFSIPDWVPGLGGKSFGLSISKVSGVSLPRLAEGGYVRANQPQPVIVGDNKTQGEIISPEGKMRDVMIEALELFFSKLQQSGFNREEVMADTGDILIPIYLDGALLDEVIVTAQQRRDIRSGGR